MLRIIELHTPHKTELARFPATVDIEERLALGNHCVVVPDCAARRKRTPFRLSPSNAAGTLSCCHARALIEVSRDACGPVRTPLRYHAHKFIVKIRGVTEQVVILAEAQFLLCTPSDGDQSIARFRVFRIQAQRRLEFRARFVSLAGHPQRTRTGRMNIRSLRIQFFGYVDGLQCFADVSLAQVNIGEPHPVVWIRSRDLQDGEIFFLGFRQFS